MQATGWRAKQLVRVAMRMLKMQIEQPRIIGLGREIMCGLKRPAQETDGLPNFWGKAIKVFGVSRRIAAPEATAGNSWR
jgi:hypothetical protein